MRVDGDFSPSSGGEGENSSCGLRRATFDFGIWLYFMFVYSTFLHCPSISLIFVHFFIFLYFLFLVLNFSITDCRVYSLLLLVPRMAVFFDCGIGLYSYVCVLNFFVFS